MIYYKIFSYIISMHYIEHKPKSKQDTRRYETFIYV